jgi:hypothetical protein
VAALKRRIAGPAVLVTVLVSGCRNDPNGGAAPVSPAGEEGATAAVAASQPSAAPGFDDAAFHVAIRAVGEYAALVPGVAEIVLTPKGAYHCNEKYPYKLKVAASPGIKYVTDTVGAGQVDLDPARAVLRLGFTPERSGQLAVGGTFAFSVCSEDRCLIERRPLSLTIAVK